GRPPLGADRQLLQCGVAGAPHGAVVAVPEGVRHAALPGRATLCDSRAVGQSAASGQALRPWPAGRPLPRRRTRPQCRRRADAGRPRHRRLVRVLQLCTSPRRRSHHFCRTGGTLRAAPYAASGLSCRRFRSHPFHRAHLGQLTGPAAGQWAGLFRKQVVKHSLYMADIDSIVLGAGVVGLAIARELAQAGPEVLVVEAAEGIGTGTSARNSEVIHAGIYYPQNSLKARLCVEGKELLYHYCAERGIAHQRLGKLIVAANPAQTRQLAGIAERARLNGVDDLYQIDGAEAARLEPALRCDAALVSPSTGIVDSHALMLALQGDAENAGAQC